MSIKVKVTAEAVVTLDPVNYQDQWEEHCDDNGEVAEGDDYPPITDEFVIEKYTEELENGTISLDEIITDTPDVKKVD